MRPKLNTVIYAVCASVIGALVFAKAERARKSVVSAVSAVSAAPPPHAPLPSAADDRPAAPNDEPRTKPVPQYRETQRLAATVKASVAHDEIVQLLGFRVNGSERIAFGVVSSISIGRTKAMRYAFEIDQQGRVSRRTMTPEEEIAFKQTSSIVSKASTATHAGAFESDHVR